MRSPLLRSASLLGLLLGVATAYCGGKVGNATGDAGGTTGPLACPAPNLVAAGAVCDTLTPCPGAPVGVCDTSEPCSCVGGRWACETPVCDTGSGPGGGHFTCPSPAVVASGAACDTTAECLGSPIGSCDTSELCSCLGGIWACDGVSCGTGPGEGDDAGSGPGEGMDAGTGVDATTGTDAASPQCYAAPGIIYPETEAGVYCPFSATAGEPDTICAAGQECCETPEAVGTPSTCESTGAACPVAGSKVWQCEGAPDCAATPGTVCCGSGKILMQPAQGGCGPGGTTVPAFAYVSGFGGTECVPAAMCAGATSFQVCSEVSECPADGGAECVPVAPDGNTIGYCSGG